MGKVVPPRKLEELRLLVAIEAAHQRGGPKKIQTELAAQGIIAELNRIKRLRRLHSIRCTHKKKFKVTTDSKHNLLVAANLLDRQFAQTTAPNQVWVADITYIPTDEGWLYLAAIKDLHTCEIVGWAMDSRMTQTLVADALRDRSSLNISRCFTIGCAVMQKSAIRHRLNSLSNVTPAIKSRHNPDDLPGH